VLRRKVSLVLTSALLVAGLMYGVLRLISVRENVGDIYPRYSTLRADPLGSKALFEALDRVNGIRVSRNYQPLVRMQPESPLALVYLGLGYSAMWEPGEHEHFEDMVAAGSRAVLVFASQEALPETDKKKGTTSAGDGKKAPAAEGEEKKGDGKKGEEKKGKKKQDAGATKKGEGKKEKAKKAKDAPKGEDARQAKDAKDGSAKEGGKEKKKKNKKKGDTEEEEMANTPFSAVAKHWGFQFEVAKTTKGKLPSDSAQLVAEGANLEPALPWRSALFFTDLKPHWKVLYRVGESPVVIERSWGKGSIVCVADSFFLSNEALQAPTRASKVVAWFVGPLHTVIFDEEHLGISESTGVATLARKYRLEGLAAGLALLVALFFWQNLVRFIPPVEEETAPAGILRGRGSSEAFVALLRRSVPRSQLLTVCLREWRRAFATDGRLLQRVAKYVVPMEGVIHTESQILAEYRTVTRLTEKAVSPTPESTELPQT